MLMCMSSPLNLWQLRTSSYLLLLLFVFIIFVFLQLPLHHNSSMERSEWEGRADAMDVLTTKLEAIGRDLDGIRQDHDGVRDAVGLFRRHLGGIY
jgi:hypothetical protein